MIKGGYKRVDRDGEFRCKLNNKKVLSICGTSDVSIFIRLQQKNYAAHVIRIDMERCIKQLMLNDDKYHKVGRTTPFLLVQVLRSENYTMDY